jgi:hydroxymethylbilane synthase
MSRERSIIGTRQSQLAIWQAEYVASRLRELYPKIEVSLKFFVTQGDKVLDQPLPQIGGKGVFTAELEAALQSGEIDLAVHSLKDLPTEIDPAFAIGAVPERAAPFDVLISRRQFTLKSLPLGAVVGTSSLRRVAQIKAIRPDVKTESLRGNVPTRIKKALAADSPYDAIILAQAGLDRLGLSSEITELLDPGMLLPAPAQGALGVQCRANDDVQALLTPLDDPKTRRAVDAERAFLNALGSGCRLPVAALARIADDLIWLTGRVISLDGATVITVEDSAPREEGITLGSRLAQQAIERGAGDLLDAVKQEIAP